MMDRIQAKVCLLGAYAVGKTSLVRRFVDNRFDDQYLSTLGVKVSRKIVERPAHLLHMLLWDIAGEEKFYQFEPSYLRGAAGALIVCDLTRIETLEHFNRLVKQLHSSSPDAAVVFAGNKLDLVDERVISENDLASACADLGGPALLTSAKTGEGVEEAFQILAELLEDRRDPTPR
jgi:small GTP-binding protein